MLLFEEQLSLIAHVAIIAKSQAETSHSNYWSTVIQINKSIFWVFCLF